MKKLLALVMALLLSVLPAMAQEEGFKFTTVDMQGNEVTEAIFADYDVTMVNVWATWCGYCIEEMPMFPLLKDKLPKNANLITICDDAAFETDTVNQILESVGANFTTLQANEELYAGLMGYVYAFPTTLFVDSEGKLIGQPIVGVPSMDLEEAMNAYYQAIMLRLNIIE